MMAKKLQIAEQLLRQTRAGELSWHNFKDENPKYVLPMERYEKIRVLVKYPKQVLPLQDGYNKYQSYYAFKDNLTLAVTKGKRDDQLLLIVGTVTPLEQAPPIGDKPRKRRFFDQEIAVFTNQETEGIVQTLHDSLHQETMTATKSDTLSAIADQL